MKRQAKRTKIHFYLPDTQKLIKTFDTQKFVKRTIKKMYHSGDINFCGYINDIELAKDLCDHIGKVSNIKSKSLSKKEFSSNSFTKRVRETVSVCNTKLPLKADTVHVFVFPWFVKDTASEQFGGINAYTPYVGTIYIFVDMNGYSSRALMETVAHEYCHLAYYETWPNASYTLADNIIIEGLAENFREDVLGGTTAPWSKAFSRSVYMKKLTSIKHLLNSKNKKIHKAILFGGRKYAIWTGYSIGYWSVKKTIGTKKKYWSKIIGYKTSDFLR